MSDNPARPTRMKRLARSLSEWATMTFAALSIVCLAYWVVSICTSRADLEPLEFDPYRGQIVSTGNGRLSIRSGLDHTTEWLGRYASRPQGYRYDIISDREFILPGVAYRCLFLEDDSYNDSFWAVEVSFAIVTAVSAAIATICFLLYRVLSRQTAAKLLE